MNKEYLSDKFADVNFDDWKGELITINAPMGTGKSQFIKENLYDYAKEHNQKILFLVHRVNCKEQFTSDIEGKEDVISITTYQQIQAYNTSTCPFKFDFRSYDYVVCDEMHYFITDSSFNYCTDIALDAILQQLEVGKTVIMLSATGNEMMEYLKEKVDIVPLDYPIDPDYSFINSLTFWNKDETLDTYIKQVIESGEKAIFFIQSATKGYELYLKHKKYVTYNCGKSDEHRRYVDNEEIKQILQTGELTKQILITTTCMDAGISIYDEKIQNIYVSVNDINTMIQCLGRCRLKDNRKVNVFIHNLNNQILGGLISKVRKDLAPAECLIHTSDEEYNMEFARKPEKINIVYDDVKGRKHINGLMYFKCKTDLKLWESLVENQYGYCKYIAQLFGIEYSIEEENYRTYNLEEYLNSIIGIEMLQVKNRKALIEKINVRSNGKVLRKIGNLNGALEEQKIAFRIVEFNTSEMIDGKQKRYPDAWKVEKLVS